MNSYESLTKILLFYPALYTLQSHVRVLLFQWTYLPYTMAWFMTENTMKKQHYYIHNHSHYINDSENVICIKF